MRATALVSALLLAAASTSAQTVVPVQQDTFLRAKSPDRNEGANPRLRLHGDSPYHILLGFDLGGVDLTDLRQAEIVLTIDSLETPSGWSKGTPIHAHRIQAPWVEGSGLNQGLPEEQQSRGTGAGATWSCAIDGDLGNNGPDCAVPWQGGRIDPSQGPGVLPLNGQSGEVRLDVTQDLIDGPAPYGWLVKTEDDGKGNIWFGSQESGAGAPRLELTFDTAARPIVTFDRPRDGATVNVTDFPIEISYTDPAAAAGLDPATFEVYLDGQNVTAFFTAGPDQASGNLAGVTPGPHTLLASIATFAGVRGEGRADFTVDLAATISLPAVADATLRSDVPDRNEGANPLLRLSSTPDRAVVAFDLSGIDTTQLERARLVVSIDAANPPAGWPLSGATVDAQRLTVSFDEGNGAEFGRPAPTTGQGPGATWSCASDSTIENNAADCPITWQGAALAVSPVTAAGPVVVDGMQGELVWDVTADVQAGAGAGWLLKKANEAGGGTLYLSAREGLAGARLELSFGLGIEIQTPPVGYATPDLTLDVAVAFFAPPIGLDLGSFFASVDGEDLTSLFAVTPGGATAQLPNLHEGEQTLLVRIAANDGTTVSATRSFIIDRTEPLVSIQTPPDGTTVSTLTVDVTGTVQDLVAGTLNQDDVTVEVNGQAAVVANRSFTFTDLPLLPGDNTITVTATDRAGNVGTATHTVTQQLLPGGVRIIAGNGQSATVGTTLPIPLIVQVLDDNAVPVAGAQVVFRVVRSDGVFPGDRRVVAVVADGAGVASLPFTLGTRAGAGVDRVRVTAVGFASEAFFSATATAGVPFTLHAVSGDNQEAGTSDPLPHRLRVIVLDGDRNPVEGAPVTFAVTQGGGSVNGATAASVVSDADGFADAWWTLGPSSGLDNNQLQASFPGLSESPVTFRATAWDLGLPSDTRLQGVVVDNQDEPVPGVTVSVMNTGLETVTDAEGQFLLSGVPVGSIHLEIDATTTSRAGTWANLEFEMVTLPGIVNTLDRPIYILPLDVGGGVFLDGTADAVLTLDGVPGFRLEVEAGAATFPNGTKTGLMSVTQVHADRIPMAPGAGMQPRLIVTVQPPGLTIDPPARMTMPNVDGFPPGTIAEMFSFDHDLGMFASIGTGSVSEDGLTITSDPGFGLVKAGWHCAAPPVPSGTCSGSGGSSDECPEGCPGALFCPPECSGDPPDPDPPEPPPTCVQLDPENLLTIPGDPIWVVLAQEGYSGQTCQIGDDISFSLCADADVTIEINGIKMIEDQSFAEGSHTLPVDSSKITGAGDVVITATLGAISDDETTELKLRSQRSASLPVGGTFVKGVNLQNGSLTLSETDFSFPGRGVSLEMSRNYSNNNDDVTGLFGPGWTSTYEARLLYMDCGNGYRFTVQGGEGSGFTFYGETVSGPFHEQPGFHGELTGGPASGYDFYTKGRMRYHFTNAVWFEDIATVEDPSELQALPQNLEFIEDPHGHRVEIQRVSGPGTPIAVVKENNQCESACRELRFTYVNDPGSFDRVDYIEAYSGTTFLYKVDYSYQDDRLVLANRISADTPNRITQFGYDPGSQGDPNNLVQWIDADGKVRNVTYWSVTELPTNSPEGFYVKPNDLVRRVTEGSQVTEFFYQGFGAPLGITRVRDPRGIHTDYRLDQNGGPILISENSLALPGAPQRSTTMTWFTQDAVKQSETDALGRTTTFTIDGNGNVETESIAAGDVGPHTAVVDHHLSGANHLSGSVVTSYVYDDFYSKLLSKTDPEGVETRYTLTSTGDVESMIRNAGSLTAFRTDYEYSPGANGFETNGDLILVRDPRGNETTYTYDPFGNPLTVTAPNGEVTTNTYDARSRLTKSEVRGPSRLLRITTVSYDDLDRKVLEVQEDLTGASPDRTTEWTYLAGGNLVDQERVHVGVEGSTYKYTKVHRYDALSRLEAVSHQNIGGGAADFTVRYCYDANDNRVGELDGRGWLRRTEYDALNRPVRVFLLPANDPCSTATGQLISEISYDDVGNKLTETDLHGHTTTYLYDALYREVGRITPPVPGPNGGVADTIYQSRTSYDLVGNKTRTIDNNGNATDFVYDRHHRLIEQHDPLGNRTVMAYDRADNVILEEKYGALVGGGDALLSTKTFNAYDPANRPTGWTLSVVGADTYPTVISYDDDARTVTTLDSRNVTTIQTMDGFGQVVEELTRAGSYPGDDVRVVSTYDTIGRRRTVTDGEGHVTTTYHDGLGRLYQTDYPQGINEQVAYDENGNVMSRTDRRGIVWNSTYDGLNRLLTESLGDCPTGVTGLACSDVAWSRTLAYDDDANTVTETDARGNPTITTRDALERVIAVDDPASRICDPAQTPCAPTPHQTYWDGVNKRTEVNRRGYVTRYAYDAVNRLTRTEYFDDPAASPAQFTTITYRDGLREREEQDPNGNVTITQLDGLGRALTKVASGTWTDLDDAVQSEPEIPLEQNTYDGETANKATFTDGDGKVTSYAYDHRQRLVRMVQGSSDPAAEASASIVVTETTYDADDLKLTDSVGGVLKTTYAYDDLHRLTSQKNALDEKTSFTHDGDGNVVSQTDPAGNETAYTYEELGRPWAISLKGSATYPASLGTWNYRYDENRNLLGQWDGNDRLTAFVYDEANRRTAVHQFNQPRPVVPDPTSYTPDLLSSTTYDRNGNPLSMTDAKGQTTDYAHDHLDREVSRTFTLNAPEPAWPTVDRVDSLWDDNGNLVSRTQTYDAASSDTDEERFAYDFLNRLRQKEDVHDVRLNWFYNGNGTKQSVTDTHTGQSTGYTYDAANRLLEVGTPSGDTTYTYTVDNLRAQVAYPSGATCDYAYDAADRVTDIHTRDSGSATVSRFSYGYDVSGNRVFEHQERFTTSGVVVERAHYGDGNPQTVPGSPSSGYDAANRLRRVTYKATDPPNARTVNYQYDLGGNRTRETETGPTPKDWEYVYDGLNRLDYIQDPATEALLIDYGYDRNGNQIAKTDHRGPDPVATLFAFDVRDHLRQVTEDGTTLESLEYTADGLRATKSANGKLRQFTWDEHALLLEQGKRYPLDTHKPLSRYHYGLDVVFMTELPNLAGDTTAPDLPRFYHLDALGSVTDITDDSTTLIASYKYDAWGMFRDDVASTDGYGLKNPQHQSLISRTGFTGHFFDEETGLYSTPSRYLDPETGRFLSQDGLQYGDAFIPPSLHRYLYAQGNPLRYVDPDGHQSKEVQGGGTVDEALRGLKEAQDFSKEFDEKLAQWSREADQLDKFATVVEESEVSVWLRPIRHGKTLSSLDDPELPEIMARIQGAGDEAYRVEKELAKDAGIDFSKLTAEQRKTYGTKIHTRMRNLLKIDERFAHPRVLTEVEVDAAGIIQELDVGGVSAGDALVKDVVVMKPGMSRANIVAGETRASRVTELVFDLKNFGTSSGMKVTKTLDRFGVSPLYLRPGGDVMEQRPRHLRSLRRVRGGVVGRVLKTLGLAGVLLQTVEASQEFSGGQPEEALMTATGTDLLRDAAMGVGGAVDSELRGELDSAGVSGDARVRLDELTQQ